MTDLIDRQELLLILKNNDKKYWNDKGGGYAVSQDIIDEIRFMPNINTEQHAQMKKDCKNCIHDEVCPVWDDYNDEPCKDGYRGFCNNYNKFKDKSQYVELPCRIGETLYCVKYESGTHFSIKEFKNINLTNILILMADLENNASGIIFLTNDKSKAEARLKELNEK